MVSVNPRLTGMAGASAPALEKGLDLLEALAEERSGLTQKAIADRIGRSVGEIFRMLGVLEQRGYVTRDALSGQYRLTLRLFELAHRHPPSRLLLQAAHGEMERLANAIGHACHLVVLNSDRILVLAQCQPEQQLVGWSVRVGASFPLSIAYASVRAICAFQKPDRRKDLIERMQEVIGGNLSEENVLQRLEVIRERGFEVAESELAQGVTDISAPVIDHFGQAIATVTVPVVARPNNMPRADIIAAVLAVVSVISHGIGGGPYSERAFDAADL